MYCPNAGKMILPWRDTMTAAREAIRSSWRMVFLLLGPPDNRLTSSESFRKQHDSVSERDCNRKVKSGAQEVLKLHVATSSALSVIDPDDTLDTHERSTLWRGVLPRVGPPLKRYQMDLKTCLTSLLACKMSCVRMLAGPPMYVTHSGQWVSNS